MKRTLARTNAEVLLQNDFRVETIVGPEGVPPVGDEHLFFAAYRTEAKQAVISGQSDEHRAAAAADFALGHGGTAVERFEVAAGTNEEADAVELFPELWGLVGIESVFIQPVMRVNNKQHEALFR
jgi:hypothetical protein